MFGSGKTSRTIVQMFRRPDGQRIDGARGLEIFRREAARIRCVLLDLTMPGTSGEETLAGMKAESPAIPDILSSGFNEVQAVRRFEGKGLAGCRPPRPNSRTGVPRRGSGSE